MMRFAIRTAAVAVALGTAAAAWAQSETVKIAFIDPQSGLMAPVGTNILRSYQLVAEIANRENWVKGVRFEIVPFDNKLSPQESLNALKAAIDQGIRYVTQGNGSSVALALADAVSKHNERNPGKEVVYLNYAAVDPDLTNSKCTFWHFRFDANSDMKMEALTTYMAERKDIKAVYLINQDYSFGHQVRRAAREYLARKRPDIKIVGDELHPLAKITDFSQYVAKIKASGADTVITGNWGSDLALLIKAAKDAGLNAHFYTYYAGTTGVPTAIGDAGVDRVRYVGYWNLNNEKPGSLGERIYKEFKTRFKDDYYTVATYTVIRALAEAMNKAKSTDPVKVAFALEGLRFQSINGEVEMRASDHQLQQVLHISSWQKVDGKQVRFDSENTGYGWRTERVLEPFVAAQPTSCNTGSYTHL
ncbi:MAG: branched-chain amino acid ABC transporter substrate-binding protein, partial [Burkholderiaceae bacterium]|nr:branched-chain amino acid ABC transporter substrate-binding protein [Burkholderiaceae bacterium]